MKKLLFVIFIIANTNTFAYNILDAFKALPEHFTPTLNAILKSELINSYINRNDSIENAYFGISKITLLDTENELIKIQTSKVGKIELKIFTPTPNDTIIAYINTVCTSNCTSIIQFFNTKWEKFAIKTLTSKDFFGNTPTQEFLLFESWDMPQFIEYTFTNKNTIKANFNTLQLLDHEQQKQIEAFVKKSLTLNLKQQESNPQKYILKIR